MRLKQPLNQFIHWQLSWGSRQPADSGRRERCFDQCAVCAGGACYLCWQPNWSFTTMYRLSPNVSTSAALERLRPIFNKYRPDFPFQYHFVDEKYAEKFAVEKLVGRLAGIFARPGHLYFVPGTLWADSPAWPSSVPGEIGIRKVLGASISQVLVLITKDFIVLVGISCVIASAVAFYFLRYWLDAIITASGWGRGYSWGRPPEPSHCPHHP